MKKIATLLLAAGLVFGAATGASAIDFKAKGQWIMSFDYGQNGTFVGKENGHKKTGWGDGKQDDFEARQRVRLQLDAVASESLSGTVYFEIGDSIWGQNSSGGALGADGKIVELKQAYIDWMAPETDLKVRMGIQNITTPAYASGNSVLNDDVAGVVASYQINEMAGVTAFWARPYNDNFTGFNDANGHKNWRANYMDNMDAVGLLVPLSFDGAKVTPWGMYAGIGPNTFRLSQKDAEKRDADGKLLPQTYTNDWYGNLANMGAGNGFINSGLFPVGGARHRDFSNANGRAVGGRNLSSYANAWWGGVSADITIWDPFRVAFDFEYGSVTWEDDGRLNRQGWFATLLAEYKLDWAIPGIYGWYASGDDSNPANGSERMPTMDGNNTNKYSNFAFDGDPYIARDAVVGHSMAGTWGIGARLKDMSFIEDLKHTFRVNYIGGTNSTTMAKKMSKAGLWANGDDLGGFEGWSGGHDALYLTTGDSALEFGLSNYYKMYDNFTISLEADYIALWLDTSKSAWGARHKEGKSIPQTKDAWNINASFVYSF
ncbi:MAG: outer membrane homotrimeric porin [Desulfovibrio sp.]|uniref:outer membrane homotrimeric porin n=1 Tax=Desulfovibrio sp. TaxID=885 RepID=UPI001A7AB7AC|nr:outer membrane homotrimeric porin [Desulfovibrio sp.]MBD5418168.1 outer membrane homotrimeric porin [Desulfovibrio sp.]